MQREIDEVLAFASHHRVACALDLGCGTGQYARAMASLFPDATIWATDLSQAMLRKGARLAEAQRLERIRFYRGDLHALPHADASLDWINCSGTLHLLPDLAAAWREISRLLRPGGILTGMIVVGPLRHLQRRAHDRRRATFLDRESLRNSLEAFDLSRFESTAYGGALLFRCERVKSHGEATNDG
jgi:ubiquinone/menaquinone biosynthesis C-methylase UbiE